MVKGFAKLLDAESGHESGDSDDEREDEVAVLNIELAKRVLRQGMPL